MMVFDRDSFAILAVNEAATRFYGYSRKEFLTMSVKDIRRQESIPQLYGAVRAGDRGVRGPFIGQHQKKDGGLVDVEVHTQRQTWQSRTVILAEIHDVTEQKRAESRFRELLEAAPDAIALVNAQGRISLVNSQLEKMFGYPRKELLGQEVEALMPRVFRAEHCEHRCAFFAEPHERPMGSCLDLRALKKDGTEFPVEISLNPLETETGRYVIAAIRDISERERREQEIQKLNLELRTERLRLVTDAAMAQLKMDDLLPELLRRLRTALSADTANVFLLTPDEKYLTLWASDGLRDMAAEAIRVPVGHGLARRIDSCGRDRAEACAP
jgi:protein-histidine pros-kinase